MSDDRPIVQFPDKMVVESPKTDNAISALRTAFEALSRMLETSTKEIARSLTALSVLPDMMTQMKAHVTEQFTTLFRHQLEAQVLQRYANAEVARKKLEAAGRSEQDKVGQLEPDVQRISARYDKLLKAVASDCATRIRQLDSHAFDILDTIYPKQVQDRFSVESEPALTMVADHASQTALDRMEKLEGSLQKASSAVQLLLKQRSEFYRSLESHGTPARLESGPYHIPLLVVEVRDRETGATQRHILLAGRESPAEVPAELRDLLNQAADESLRSSSKRPLPADARCAVGKGLVGLGTVPEAELQRFLHGEVNILGETL